MNSVHRTGQAPRIVVLGGGYAALAAVSTLARQSPRSQITLIAPRKAHIKLTQLHETLRYSILRLCAPYGELAKRFGFRFVQAKLRFEPDNLKRWQQRRTLLLEKEEIPFDYLILATGANSPAPEQSDRLLTLNDFCLNHGQPLIRELRARGGKGEVTVVGAGATGIQFLFELSAYLRQGNGKGLRLRLVNFESRMLAQLPPPFHDYALERMRRENIDYLPETAFQRQEGGAIVLTPRGGGREFSLPSGLTLSFMGVRPSPFAIETDAFGRATGAGEPLERIFAAGDCARFAGPGANALSAQNAVRKGKLVAENLIRQIDRQPLATYDYAEQGYVVSLGPADAIGWVGHPGNIITGLPAVAAKKATEAKYGLMLSGIDSYRV